MTTIQNSEFRIQNSKIVFVCSSLGAGGAERVLSTLANAWAQRGIEVTILTLGATGNDFYELDARVKRIGLDMLRPSSNKLGVLTGNFERAWALRRSIAAEAPTVVISFMDKTNILVLLATRGLRIPIIVSERVDPRFYRIAAGWDWLRRRTYRWADSVVVQTRSVAEWAGQLVEPDQVAVIANPLSHRAASGQTTRHLKIVGMGRLDRQKGFDLLIQAFAAVAARHPEWALHIYGDGPERGALEALAQGERVVLEGRTSTPHEVLSQAGLFVLSSRFEGMPNVLLEAMACGTPCISFDCPSGPAEIIETENNGALIQPEDVVALAAAMDDLMGDAEKRERLGEAARAVAERFSVDAVLQEWNHLINKVTNSKSR